MIEKLYGIPRSSLNDYEQLSSTETSSMAVYGIFTSQRSKYTPPSSWRERENTTKKNEQSQPASVSPDPIINISVETGKVLIISPVYLKTRPSPRNGAGYAYKLSSHRFHSSNPNHVLLQDIKSNVSVSWFQDKTTSNNRL